MINDGRDRGRPHVSGRGVHRLYNRHSVRLPSFSPGGTTLNARYDVGCGRFTLRCSLSGVMAAQTFLFYFRMFPEDPIRIKVMVRSAGHRWLVDNSPSTKKVSVVW